MGGFFFFRSVPQSMPGSVLGLSSTLPPCFPAAAVTSRTARRRPHRRDAVPVAQSTGQQEVNGRQDSQTRTTGPQRSAPNPTTPAHEARLPTQSPRVTPERPLLHSSFHNKPRQAPFVHQSTPRTSEARSGRGDPQHSQVVLLLKNPSFQ